MRVCARTGGRGACARMVRAWAKVCMRIARFGECMRSTNVRAARGVSMRAARHGCAHDGGGRLVRSMEEHDWACAHAAVGSQHGGGGALCGCARTARGARRGLCAARGVFARLESRSSARVACLSEGMRARCVYGRGCARVLPSAPHTRSKAGVHRGVLKVTRSCTHWKHAARASRMEKEV